MSITTDSEHVKSYTLAYNYFIPFQIADSGTQNTDHLSDSGVPYSEQDTATSDANMQFPNVPVYVMTSGLSPNPVQVNVIIITVLINDDCASVSCNLR